MSINKLKAEKILTFNAKATSSPVILIASINPISDINFFISFSRPDKSALILTNNVSNSVAI